MKSFFKSLGAILVLIIAATYFSEAFPTLAFILGFLIFCLSVFAVFKPLPKLQLGHRGFAASVAIFIAMPMMLTNVEEADLAGSGTTRKSAPAVQAAVPPVASADDSAAENSAPIRTAVAEIAPTADKPAIDPEVTSYLSQMDREIASLADFDISDFTGSLEDIKTGVILIGAWSLLYENGGGLDLGEDGRAKRHTYKKQVQKVQARLLPAMRDAYGPALRKELWEADGTAKTIGP